MTTKVTASVLANTGVTAGTYGTSSTVPIITIDAQGRITSATAATVSGAGAGVGATTYTVTKFTATAGQTVFTVNYTVGYVQVYLNGVLLDYATDFTASNGTSITLATAAALDDIITVYAFSVSSVANITGGAAGAVLYQSAANTTSNTDVGTSGQLLVSGGSGKPVWIAQTALSIANTQITGLITAPQIAPSAIPAGGFSNMRVFTSPGCFSIPPSSTKVKVTVVGGGGSGGTTPLTIGTSVGGGGGGGFATRVISSPFPVTLVPVSVGGAGGTSSFGTYASATGGGSTTYSPNSLPTGSGGTGSLAPGATTCGYTMPGQVGQHDNISGAYMKAVSGGDAGGGFGKGGRNAMANAPAKPGTNYGGGGSGATIGCCQNPAPIPGGTGAPGIVVVEW